jgi:hypothetical protein
MHAATAGCPGPQGKDRRDRESSCLAQFAQSIAEVLKQGLHRTPPRTEWRGSEVHVPYQTAQMYVIYLQGNTLSRGFF